MRQPYILDYHEICDYVKKEPIIINIDLHNFSVVRNGDLLAILNLIEYLRIRENNQQIKCYIYDTAFNRQKYCLIFRDFLACNTNYFSAIPGTTSIKERAHDIWEIRQSIGEHLVLDLCKSKQNKTCIFPIYDAPYNIKRNWSKLTTQNILDRIATDTTLANTEKIICIKDIPNNFMSDFDLSGFTISTDFKDNINHILTCKTYIGGDTGFTHFASVLKNRPKILYYINTDASKLTYPFYLKDIDFTFF